MPKKRQTSLPDDPVVCLLVFPSLGDPLLVARGQDLVTSNEDKGEELRVGSQLPSEEAPRDEKLKLPADDSR